MTAWLPIVTCVLGFFVLLSYYLSFRGKNKNGYTNSSLWLGLPKPFVYIAVAFQLLGAAGFLVMIISWSIHPPSGGFLGTHEAVLVIIVAVILMASMAWAPLTMHSIENPTSWAARVGAVTSLIVTAIGSILLVAGACEESKPRWYVMIGAILFAIVTVLFDSVAYNSRFVKYPKTMSMG